jgi:hypothetical protein
MKTGGAAGGQADLAASKAIRDVAQYTTGLGVE